MATPRYRIRTGTIHGVKHAQFNMNNQDAVQILEFSIPRWEKNYRIGLVLDGCSGIPAFTRTEVGANLLAVFCLGRIQEFIIGKMKLEDIPQALYHAVTSFLRDLANTVAPANIYWPYSVSFTGSNEFRNTLKAPQRFMTDYLAATIVGFVDDGLTLVTFQAGDGVIIVNDDVRIVDQNDRPDYPALSVNSPGGGFDVCVYPAAEAWRVALATDGIEELLAVPDLGMVDRLFADAPEKPMGLQYLLNRLRKQYPEKLGDDCTVVAMERLDGDEAS